MTSLSLELSVSLVFWLSVLCLIYTYAGYPALLGLLARLRPPVRWRRLDGDNELPAVTLLISAYNEQSVLRAKLDNCLALDYPRRCMQILVAADGSSDDTTAIVAEYSGRGVNLSYQPERRGKVSAINRALMAATGQVIVFSDANNAYLPDALRRLVAPLADNRVGAVSGAKVIAAGDGNLGDAEGLYWKYESYIKSQETCLGSCVGVAGEILAIRRDLIDPVPEKVINDDFYLAMRVIRRGYRVVYEPQAISIERVSVNEKEEALRRSRIVAGRYQALAMLAETLPFRQPLVVWELVSHKYLRPLAPFAMLGAFIANLTALAIPSSGVEYPFLLLAEPIDKWFFIAQVVFYLLAWAGGKLHGSGFLGRVLYVPTFLVNSNLAALSGLVNYLTGRQSQLWRSARRRE